MSHRVDHWHEALVEHLQEREWSDVQITNLTHRIGHSALLSCEGILEVLEYQQEVDEAIVAQKEADRWAIGREFSTQPTTYVADAGWDENGTYRHYQQRFEERE